MVTKRNLTLVLLLLFVNEMTFGNCRLVPTDHPKSGMEFFRAPAIFPAQVHTAKCSTSRSPEPLTTPTPLLDFSGTDAVVTVSFIINSDGLVQSPFILKSAGPTEDERVLDVVRTWRYRPAFCNGAPSEAEARVQFSSR